MVQQIPGATQLDPATLDNVPLSPPPNGVNIHFHEQNPWKATAIAVTSIFVILAIIFTSIRSYTKIKILSKGSWDDLSCALGLISTLTYWIIFLLLVEQGVGKHIWNIPYSLALDTKFLKLSSTLSWFSSVPYIFVKLTFFILYWNIFKPFRWLRYGIVTSGIVVIGFYIAVTLANMTGAFPRPGTSWVDRPGCDICQKTALPTAIWALVSDTVIFVLPIFGVLRLQLHPKKKFGVLLVFMTGFGACICSSVSIYYRRRYNESEDITYNVVPAQMLIIVELCVGICITCAPATSKFLRHIFPRESSSETGFEWRWRKIHSSLSALRTHDHPKANKLEVASKANTGLYQKMNAKGDRRYGDCELALYSRNATTTVVVSQPSKEVSDGVIHLKVDLEQRQSHASL